jgi:hypothetical protein
MRESSLRLVAPSNFFFVILELSLGVLMIDLFVVYVLNVEEAPVTTVDLGCLVVVVGDTVVFGAVVSLN